MKAEDLAAALGDLCFNDEHKLLMAELPAGAFHAALLPPDSGDHK